MTKQEAINSLNILFRAARLANLPASDHDALLKTAEELAKTLSSVLEDEQAETPAQDK